MIIKCSSCDGALEFNAQTGKMECRFCGNSYVPEQGNSSQKIFYKRETMECNIYACTSCGAQLAVNRVESSSFCAYCGQPTIVFSRVSQELKPDYIIPFRITKEQAFNIVRQRFAKGAVVPKAIKEFKIEKMRGIYIPYFIYDIVYRDTKTLTGEVDYAVAKSKKYYIRQAEGEFKGIVYDASKQLNDELAIRLEPYDLGGVKPFAPEYLSGFYADKYDLDWQEVEAYGAARAKQFFDIEMKKSVKADSVYLLNLGKPSYEFQKIQYALMPVWFITFRYKNEPYTILINGQTGKMVGSVPIDAGNLWTVFFASLFGISIAGTFLIALYCGLMMFIPFLVFGFFPLFFGIIITAMCMSMYAFQDYKKIRHNIKNTKARATAKFVRERQDRT